ncbi:MAG: hypothetical protein ACTSP4_10470, partial [Candidatus Hodarchaeales archaeon]
MDPNLEITSRDGLSKYSRMHIDGNQIHFPRLVDSQQVLAVVDNTNHQEFSNSVFTSKNSLVLLFHPSAQLLEFTAENKEISRRLIGARETQAARQTVTHLHVLPADGLISANKDLSGYFTFLDDYIEHNDLNPGLCGIRVPDLQREKIEQISAYIKKKGFLLVSLSSTAHLITNPERMSDYLKNIHESLPPRLLIHSPACLPSWYPLLAYTGIDLFDTTGIKAMTIAGQYLTGSGNYSLPAIHDNDSLPCDCQGCKSILENKGKNRDTYDHLL